MENSRKEAKKHRKITLFIFIFFQLVEKLRCILSLPNLFPSLAHHFACCQSCSVSAPFGLTALTTLRRVLLKNRRLVKVNLEVSSQLEFYLKINCGLTVLKNEFFSHLEVQNVLKIHFTSGRSSSIPYNSKIKT